MDPRRTPGGASLLFSLPVLTVSLAAVFAGVAAAGVARDWQSVIGCQLLLLAVGVALLVVVARQTPETLWRWTPGLTLAAWALLAAELLTIRMGQRWPVLGEFLELNRQHGWISPAELTKPLFVLAVTREASDPEEARSWRGYGARIVWAFPWLVLVWLLGDSRTLILLALVLVFVAWLQGWRRLQLGVTMAGAAAVNWLRQAMVTGSRVVPEVAPRSDLPARAPAPLAAIMTVFGIGGGLVVLGSVAVWLVAGMRVSSRQPSRPRTLLVAGLVFWIAVQSLATLTVALAELELTALPLPFFTTAPSPLLAGMLAVGMIMSCRRSTAASPATGGGNA